ncbi:hypothetical protein JOM56_011553 [Amanita muscaria]
MAVFFYILLSLLAGRVSAVFNLTVGNQVLLAGNILDIPSSGVQSACSTNCSAADATLKGCQDDSACLCRNNTISSLSACEQCMFDFLVARFQEAPDPKVGSQAVLDAYAAACQATNQTLTPRSTSLLLGPNWNGPEDTSLSTGGAVVVVTIGGLLGVSALYLLWNL